MPLPAGDQHIEKIPDRAWETKNGGPRPLAGMGPASGHQDRKAAVAEQIREIPAMALAGEWQTGGEGRVAEFAAVEFEQHQRLEAIHARTAVSQEQINVNLVI